MAQRLPRGFHYPVGGYAPGRAGWGPVARPIRVPPIGLYRRQAQTFIGGYGVGSAVTGGQVARNASTSITTLTVTLARPTGAGNCLVACVGMEAATTAPTVSAITLGGLAGNWSAAAATGGGTTVNSAIWVDPNCAGGQTSVVITFTGGVGIGGVAAYVYEVPGVQATVGFLDSNNQLTSLSSSTFSISTSAPVQVQEVAFAAFAFPVASIPAGPGAPWSESGILTPGSAVNLIAGFQSSTNATSPFTYAGTVSPAGIWAGCITNLKLVSTATIGTAQLSLGPAGFGTRWYPNQVNVATAVGAADTATCAGYLNVIGQGGFLFQSYAGGGDQIGLAVPQMLPGDRMYIVWTGSQPGIAVQAVILGAQSVLAM